MPSINIFNHNKMKLKELCSLISGVIVVGETCEDLEIECVFASDLMSDILTAHTDKSPALLTGLVNLQAIRTCEMSDIKVIVFVRGKKATDEMKALAKESEIILVESPYSMYRAAGILYKADLASVY